jgi:hypothetical protein
MWGSEGIAPPFLTSALDGGAWSASRFRHFTLERATGSHWIRAWVGPRAGPDAVEYYFFIIILSGVRLSLLVLRPLLAYCTSPG